MARKPIPKPDNPDQSKRFIDMAREVEAEGSKENFEKAFKKVAKEKSVSKISLSRERKS